MRHNIKEREEEDVHKLSDFSVRVLHQRLIRSTFEDNTTSNERDMVKLLDESYAVRNENTGFVREKAFGSNEVV